MFQCQGATFNSMTDHCGLQPNKTILMGWNCPELRASQESLTSLEVPYRAQKLAPLYFPVPVDC